MEPTRNIVKPNTALWRTKQPVWFQKNDDIFNDSVYASSGHRRHQAEQEDIFGDQMTREYAAEKRRARKCQ